MVNTNTVEKELTYHVEKLHTVVGERRADYGMEWLSYMLVGTREYSPDLELFDTAEGFKVSPESLNHLLPPVITCFTMAQNRCGEATSAMGVSGAVPLSGFVKGVSALNNLVASSSQDYVADLLIELILSVIENNEYPAIDERFWPAYSDIATAILLNEEMTTWAEMLGFNLGVWWLMGFLKDAETKQPNVSGKLDYHAQLKRMLLEYARLGMVYSG